jgi:hypothetical protein
MEELSKRMENVRRKIEEYGEKGYDKKYEDDWKKLLNELNDIKLKIYKEKIFSDNEEFKDIKTEDIKFMLVAFYQSELIQKFMVNRKNILEFALKFYDEFFKLLKSYDYLSKEQVKKYEKLTYVPEEGEKEPKKTPKQSFQEMSQNRTEKIEMYKYKKNLSEKLKKMEKDYEKLDDNREYWVDYLNINIVKMFETIPSIKTEIDAIKYMEKMKKENQNKPPESKNTEHKKIETLTIKSPEDLLNLDPNNKLVQNLNFVTSFEPNKFQFFNLGNGLQTLDEQILAQLPQNIREKVFKNRNPTEMTVEEFGELQKKRMEEEEKKHKEHEKNKSDSDSDKEEVDDKKKKKAREWDDWKDDHPKGSGNRNGW